MCNILKAYVLLFLDTECQLFSTIVAAHWNPDSTDNTDLLNSHKCFSSWHKRNDISNQATITASASYAIAGPKQANDGFYCQLAEYFFFHSIFNVIGGAWMQIDLNSYFNLKCIRIPIRSEKVYWSANFHDIEFRFGNKSKDEDFSLNPVIAYSEPGLEGTIFEACLDTPLVGKYLLLISKQQTSNGLIIGEIQILVN